MSDAPLPPPMRPLRCGNVDCGLPEGGRCARESEFSDPLGSCVDLSRFAQGTLARPAPAAQAPTSAPEARELSPVAWSGQHVSVAEGLALLRSGPTALVAVVGPAAAGKTSLLASLFLQLANGRRPGFSYRFAGCRSLRSFDSLVRSAAAWSGSSADTIVDHTTSSEAGELRSFLHLALVPELERRSIDLLLTDVPGEWFDDWADVSDDRATRRLPFLRRCGAVLLLVDAEALLAEGGGGLDQRSSQVIRRLQTDSREWRRRPILRVVFTKLDRVTDRLTPPAGALCGDLPPDPAGWGPLRGRARRIWGALRDAGEEGLPVSVAGVSAFPSALAAGQPYGVTELFGTTLAALDRPVAWPRTSPTPSLTSPPFAWMGRWSTEGPL